jgi:hypothetical protein
LDRDRLLQREIAAVDLRLADRERRIRDKAELTMPDSGSALPDVPTSHQAKYLEMGAGDAAIRSQS